MPDTGKEVEIADWIQNEAESVELAQEIADYTRREATIVRAVGGIAAIDPEAAHAVARDMIWFDPTQVSIGINALVEVGKVTGNTAYIDEALTAAKARTRPDQLGVKLGTIVRRGFEVDPDCMTEVARAIEIPNARAKVMAHIAGRQGNPDLLKEVNDFAEAEDLRSMGVNNEISEAGLDLDYRISIRAHMRTQPRDISESRLLERKHEYVLECADHAFRTENQARLLEISHDVAEAFLWASQQVRSPEAWRYGHYRNEAIEEALTLATEFEIMAHKDSVTLLTAARNLIDTRIEQINERNLELEPWPDDINALIVGLADEDIIRKLGLVEDGDISDLVEPEKS